MKKILSFFSLAAIFLMAATPSLAAGAVKYDWHLSGDVMPVPPYGSQDIIGSDTTSKLIFNQPNGKVQGNLTGVMNGLLPNTTYNVFISNSYTAYSKASVLGDWTWLYGGAYNHAINITTQNPDGTFSGTGSYPAGGPEQTSETITGQIVGNTITFKTHYNGPYNPGYEITLTGTINPDGSITGDNWTAPAGSVDSASGSTTWPGLLSGISVFSFTTDANGSGSWHYNIKQTLAPLSVWINNSVGTLLISDSISQ